MGEIHPFEREKLMIGVLAARHLPDGTVGTTGAEVTALERLVALYGPVDFRSPELPFRWTPYYDSEMGPGIVRYFLSFRDLVDPACLPDIKIATNGIEDSLARQGCRPVNLDPGLLSLGRLILATTKNRAQRIPLARGIYAEVTLLYEHHGFTPLTWTYPDYRSPEYHAIFAEIRSILHAQLKQGGESGQ